MRVLVLGARGFVGRHVLSVLSKTDGFTAIAGVRKPASSDHLLLDARNAEQLRCAFDRVDAVVNCVTGSPRSIVENARALFTAAAGTGVQVLYLSSMAVYGSATGRLTEDAPLSGDVGPYSAAKVKAERLAQACPAHVTVFRPGIIYGSGSPQWTERIARLLQARRIGDLGAAGDGCCNLAHVHDVVKAVIAVLHAGRSPHAQPARHRVYNLAMPDAPDWNWYFLQFARALGAVPVKRITNRRLVLETKVLAAPLKLAEILSDSRLPPAIPPALARAWRHDLRLDNTRATQELSMSWMTLSEGLSEAVAGLHADRRLQRKS
jgi:nucleoside-diphosphate-sugar epimerase